MTLHHNLLMVGAGLLSASVPTAAYTVNAAATSPRAGSSSATAVKGVLNSDAGVRKNAGVPSSNADFAL